jgi:hypothetical protein
MTTELRDYTIEAGKLDQFVEEWRRGVVPLRQSRGYRIDSAWRIPEENRFVWLLTLDVPPEEWDEHNDAYYADPARAALDPDPARLIVSQRHSLLERVELPAP